MPKRRAHRRRSADRAGAWWPDSCYAVQDVAAHRLLILAVTAIACAHAPRRAPEPTPGQVGCYQVRVENGLTDLELPRWFREHIPEQVALSIERENAEEAL